MYLTMNGGYSRLVEVRRGGAAATVRVHVLQLRNRYGLFYDYNTGQNKR